MKNLIKVMKLIKKEHVFILIPILVMVILFELLATLAVHHNYKEEVYHNNKIKKENPSLYRIGFSSSMFVLDRVLTKLSLKSKGERGGPAHELIVPFPKPFHGPSELHGYAYQTGEFKLRYYDYYDATDFHQANVTILEDGSRYVGRSNDKVFSNVFVFGDSTVFGFGLSDEQTFTYLLQQKYPKSKFHLFAAGGWSLSNALVNIEILKEIIDSNDVIILGYADYYKQRHVAAPSLMKSFKKPRPTHPEGLGYLKFSLTNKNELSHTVIPLFCEKMASYCKKQDPSEAEMNNVTVSIINKIASTVKAKVILLHFEGSSEDPILKSLDPQVEILTATPDTFSYSIKDTIEGFDGHPGPFWHYALYTRISEYLIDKLTR